MSKRKSSGFDAVGSLLILLVFFTLIPLLLSFGSTSSGGSGTEGGQPTGYICIEPGLYTFDESIPYPTEGSDLEFSCSFVENDKTYFLEAQGITVTTMPEGTSYDDCILYDCITYMVDGEIDPTRWLIASVRKTESNYNVFSLVGLRTLMISKAQWVNNEFGTWLLNTTSFEDLPDNDSGNQGGTTTPEGGDSGNQGGTTTPDDGGSSGNQGGTTTPEGGDSGNQGGTTTPEGGDSGNQGGTTTPDDGGSSGNQGGTTSPDDGGNSGNQGGTTTPEGGDSGNQGGTTTPDDGEIEELITIEPGLYTFDESIPYPTEGSDLEFTCSFVENGKTYFLKAQGIALSTMPEGTSFDDCILYDCITYMIDGEIDPTRWLIASVRKTENNYNVFSMVGLRTLTISKTQSVSNDFGTWLLNSTTYETLPDNEGEDDNGNNSGNNGSFGNTPTYKENTIYAGTYRFIDTPDTGSEYTIPLPFTVVSSPIYVNDQIVSVDYSLLVIENTDGDFNQIGGVGVLYLDGNLADGAFGGVFYDDIYSNPWSAFNTIMSVFPIGYGQIITVTADTEVDDTSYTWFTSNTQMLIKAGEYRWNDVVNIRTTNSSVYTPLPISVPIVTLEIEGFGSIPYGGIFEGIAETYGGGIGVYNGDEYYRESETYYTNENKWNEMYAIILENGFDLPPLKGLGQVFEVTADTYVPADFGTLFVCNAVKWEASASETSEATATVFNIDFNEVYAIPHNKDDLMCA